MESWRERGYVPDSDSESEDGFGSQDIEALTSKDDEGAGVPVTEDVATTPTKKTGQTSKRDRVEEEAHNSPSGDDAEVSQNDTPSQSTVDRDVSVEDGQETLSVAQSEEEGKQEADDTSEAGIETLNGKTEEQEIRSQTPSARGEEAESRSSPGLPDAPDAPDVSPSTPRAKQNKDVWAVPSSSPDELQFEFRPVRKPVTHPSRVEEDGTQPRENMDLSPLSSPLSSLHSLRSDDDTQEAPDNQDDRIHTDDQGPQNDQNDQERTETASEQNLEELLPPLEIPEDILQELAQPMRRSLRQRNPIQMHPYLLEDAKYQNLMKARGIKPVRIAQYQQALRDREAAESQNQNSFESAAPPSSSPVPDFQSLPSSPADPRQVLEKRTQHTPGRRRDHQPSGPSSPGKGAHIPKRRKISHPDRNKQNGPQNSPKPRVVIDNSTTPRGSEPTSIFDIHSTPPRSGSISSTQTIKPSGVFRFPPGFTPPATNTPATESRLQTTNADDANAMDLSEDGGDGDQDPTDVESISSQSQANSDAEDGNDNDEAAVKAMKRRIKGVLPASWLRLDQQKQTQKLPSSTQRHRDLAAAQRAENGKGVAKKIMRRGDSTRARSPNRPLAALSHLADDDDSDDDRRDNSPARDNTREVLASIVGFDDPFHDQDIGDDLPEDNRIDYMFPSVPRASSSRSGKPKPGKKRQRPEKDSMRSESHRKRARLKRQTRITDSAYGGQQAKRSSFKVPRLGILDAPEVAQQPRKEQPQFLRVAARQARSRRDEGRESPTRKFVKLGSRLDTEDANSSLREWRKGKISQQKRSAQPRPKPSQRRTLMNFLADKRDSFDLRNAQGTSRPTVIDIEPTVRSEGRGTTPEPVSSSNLPTSTPTLKQNIASKRAPQFEQRGNKWVIRRNLAISSLKRNTPRPAEPEIENTGGNTASPTLFQRSLSALNQDYRQKRTFQTNNQSLTLDRFLSDSASSANPPGSRQPPPARQANAVNNAGPQAPFQARPRQLKKRPPKRLDLGAAEHQEPPTILSPAIESPAPRPDFSRPSNQVAGGLVSFQRSYPVDFNITPLSPGTFFHESTFVGSGEFARSLDVLARDLDKDAGLFHLNVGDRSFRWSAWNDTVSSELGLAFEKLTEEIENGAASMETDVESNISKGCTIYRSMVKYVTESLTFIDPIDRTGFVTRVHSLVSELNDNLTAFVSTNDRNRNYLIRIASYDVVFANQICQVASHNIVNDAVANEALQLLKSVSKQILILISNQEGPTEIRKFLNDNKISERRDTGVSDHHATVEAYVIVQRVLRNTEKLKGCFEDFVAENLLEPGVDDQSKPKEVPQLENGWHSLFTTLPLSEVDQFGIGRVGSRFRESHDNWKMVKRLLSPVLDDYQGNSATQPFSFNNYCRVLFHRCFHLINGWGWRDCRVILNTLYDFFARKTGLYNLSHEESFGSPAFLDDLDRNPSLDVIPGDPCFHILLKIIGSGLRFMSTVYDKKKIRNFAWCLLPNHGRVYPKEASVRQEDLDALRNHHDLLCTLYFAVPEGCRPRLETIRGLVHPGNSHREACNISIRSWLRLARFKISTDEDVSGLDAFADWHSYFVTELLKQHSLARKEVEAQSGEDNQFPHKLIERTISQNQRQIESLLNTALAGLRSSVQLSPTIEHSQRLVSKMPVKAVLGLFNPKLARVNTTVSEALQIILAYIQKCESPAAAAVVAVQASADEDSQEYGDWTEFEDMYKDESAAAPAPTPTSQAVEHIEAVFHPAVSRLVSNCFGEDYCPEDAILLTVVDCWTSVAQTLVTHKLRHWDNYLSPYDGDSWTALRSTVQTRKFTPQFLASCIEKDSHFISECRVQILGMWMSTLVERASMLKFQHRLTEALLHQDRANPLLHNLPFSRDRKSERYSITLEDFSQRRLSLISSLLSNMREHLQDMEDTDNRDLPITKQEYRELIQRLMSSMKSNYQELGNGSESIQGAYVNFVHRIVGFLQQHSRDICPIDPFFTDPTSFPLPSTDPTYIVARLKSYEPKLSTEKVAKTLIVFIQGVSERAAIDGQQSYLVDQLHASMENTYEAGNPNKPTLRAILLQCVFPAYLEIAFSKPAAWILTLPILQTISLVFKDLLFSIDTTDPSCVSSVTNVFNSVFQSSYQALHLIAEDVNMLKEPPVLVTVTAFTEMITSALRVIDYIDRVTDMGEKTVLQVQAFRLFALYAVSYLKDQLLADDDYLAAFTELSSAFTATRADTATITVPPFFQETRHSASRELQTYINESWSRHNGRYYFTRRGCHQPQEVGIDPSIASKLDHMPEAAFEDAVGVFSSTLETLDLFDDAP
ncbi:hypothetical protein ASPWEDRAFT_44523 [Aspergillus wentii DTO 134E9]|uniref:Uncharacterized protein n=1 Tax=Aspergillus wentii DTO 134E9 TaxID=1073089 RepID=A0A1L9RBW8_ASPWE|nr:uncharacterized protein ASPWEDRAFT_44523 [Aspergillus wentii DTO 134E9]OJJ32411.1 hypothetical protein ASPWEDRAFT_44523 [Aspergillus wentii DTO 134E9]